jgi:hypothetical protein
MVPLAVFEVIDAFAAVSGEDITLLLAGVDLEAVPAEDAKVAALDVAALALDALDFLSAEVFTEGGLLRFCEVDLVVGGLSETL